VVEPGETASLGSPASGRHPDGTARGLSPAAQRLSKRDGTHGEQGSSSTCGSFGNGNGDLYASRDSCSDAYGDNTSIWRSAAGTRALFWR